MAMTIKEIKRKLADLPEGMEKEPAIAVIGEERLDGDIVNVCIVEGRIVFEVII